MLSSVHVFFKYDYEYCNTTYVENTMYNNNVSQDSNASREDLCFQSWAAPACSSPTNTKYVENTTGCLSSPLGTSGPGMHLTSSFAESLRNFDSHKVICCSQRQNEAKAVHFFPFIVKSSKSGTIPNLSWLIRNSAGQLSGWKGKDNNPVDVRLGATESELGAPLCHCLTPGGSVYSAKPK